MFDPPGIRLLLPLLLNASPILANFALPKHESPADEENGVLTPLFWTLVALGLLPFLYIYVPDIAPLMLQRKVKRYLNDRRVAPLHELWANATFPADLTQIEPSLTSHQTQQLFSLMRSLMAIPVLKIREVILTGTFIQEVKDKDSKEKNSTEKESKETFSKEKKRPENAEVKARSPLAMEIINHHVMPVYDNPYAFTEPKKYKNTGQGTEIRPLLLPWTAGFSGHVVFEISNRFPAYQNDNKFRVAFDVWNSTKRQYFVIFGVGSELPTYCKRVFTLKKLEPPECKSTDPLIRQLEEVGIQTTYYQCTYKSEKLAADTRRTFLLAFHNIPVEEDHPFSGRLPEMRQLPLARLMFLAHQLDAPVFCVDPEVHLVLSLLHTSFFYILHCLSDSSKVPLDAIDIAMDRMEVTALWPSDSVHLYALQLMDFCGKFIEDAQAKSPTLQSQPLLSYHFLPKKKAAARYTSAPLSESQQRKEGGQEKTLSSRECLAAYEKSVLDVNGVVEQAKGSKTKIDWKASLPEEVKFLGYAFMETTYYMNIAFEHYYFEFQHRLEELRYRREEREDEYNKRRTQLETAKPPSTPS